MVLFKSTGMAFAVTFGLALAGSFWWEVAEPIRNSNWSGSGEQWFALASLVFGGCATLVAGGALFALTSRSGETIESPRALPKRSTSSHLIGPRRG
jgi:hypothetical protein